MRRRAVALLLPLALLAACTDEVPAPNGAPGGAEPEVGGAFGARPTIVFPAGRPAAGLRVNQPAEGKGAPLEPDAVAIVQYTAHVWDGGANRLVDSSFNRGAPAAFPVGRLLPGLDRALRGRRVGSRIVAAIPPGEGFGANPPQGVGPGDDLLYVIDILGAHARGVSVKGAAARWRGCGSRVVPVPGCRFRRRRRPGGSPPRSSSGGAGAGCRRGSCW
ncbi:FKBP-type peptidyl-prolyl cis-trans isomerase [Nonomuraea sp. NPDC005983]|uniref:FKBP-type peptidyl-prolyl cis-trans isomerase n=1 Tax=Nonomuraea sp. NPDC005983 TaxID=3155595 RepID=UPI0033A7BB55